jgi:glycerate dehydrogenase
MHLVILDGYTLNPGDLTWDALNKIAKITYYDRTPKDQIAARLTEADGVLTNKAPITAETIAACPKLKYISVTASGYNIIDLEATKKQGVVVTNVPGYSTQSVAQTVFALLLEITHHVGHHSDAVREGEWVRSADFSFSHYPLMELAGLKMGIVGFGATGQATGRIAHAFGMEVLVSSRSKPTFDGFPYRLTEMSELFQEADVISLHCPLTPATKGLVSWPLLEKMKRSAILINTARGPLLNEADVARALSEKVIAYAGMDVLSAEPPPADNPLLTAPNCLIVPHIAWASFAARQRLMHETVENVRAFIDQKPRNVVG